MYGETIWPGTSPRQTESNWIWGIKSGTRLTRWGGWVGRQSPSCRTKWSEWDNACQCFLLYILICISLINPQGWYLQFRWNVNRFVNSIYNNKEAGYQQRGRLIIKRPLLSGLTQCVGMHRTGVQSYSPACKISKLQTNRHTSSEQIQACRPTGVKNYMLADVFFFSFCLSFLFFILFF